jgi:hypothetical protein
MSHPAFPENLIKCSDAELFSIGWLRTSDSDSKVARGHGRSDCDMTQANQSGRVGWLMLFLSAKAGRRVLVARRVAASVPCSLHVRSSFNGLLIPRTSILCCKCPFLHQETRQINPLSEQTTDFLHTFQALFPMCSSRHFSPATLDI